MIKFYKFNECPKNTLINLDLKSFDYCDSYMILKKADDSIHEITTRILTLPNWVSFLLNLRYYIVVKLFNLTSGTHAIPILFSNENEMVMGEDDKHLYFRISIMKKVCGQGTQIYLTPLLNSIIYGENFIFY